MPHVQECPLSDEETLMNPVTSGMPCTCPPTPKRVRRTLSIELDRETDGRWTATIHALSGLTYAWPADRHLPVEARRQSSAKEAAHYVKRLALLVLSDRFDEEPFDELVFEDPALAPAAKGG